MFKSIFIASLCSVLAGCASIPSFPLLSGENKTASIVIHDVAKNKDLSVPIIVYTPSSQAKNKPAIIFLSGCDGGHWNVHNSLARDFNKKGVVIVEVKSIDTYGNQCMTTNLMGWRRSDHAFAAKEYLVKQGIAQDNNIAFVGLSHGGWTGVHVAKMDAQNAKSPFVAVVSLYPWCDLNIPSRASASPLLILGGSEDTWTPIRQCTQLLSNDDNISIHVYEGATHAWDAPRGPRTIPTQRGTTFMAYDHKVTEDSIVKSREFLLKHIKLN